MGNNLVRFRDLPKGTTFVYGGSLYLKIEDVEDGQGRRYQAVRLDGISKGQVAFPTERIAMQTYFVTPVEIAAMQDERRPFEVWLKTKMGDQAFCVGFNLLLNVKEKIQQVLKDDEVTDILLMDTMTNTIQSFKMEKNGRLDPFNPMLDKIHWSRGTILQ